MTVRGSRRLRLSSSKRVNPYRACNYGLCRDFLCGGGYDLGTDFYSLFKDVESFPDTVDCSSEVSS